MATGPLPFEQDLLYSKLVKAGAIRRAVESRDGDGDIDSTLALLRSEPINAIFTSDILETLRRVAGPTADYCRESWRGSARCCWAWPQPRRGSPRRIGMGRRGGVATGSASRRK